MLDEPKAWGLLALIRVQSGEVEQGRDALQRAIALRGQGQYVLQAAIAACHAEPVPDREEIAALYGRVSELTGSPVVAVNGAVAVAGVRGPEAGLALATSSAAASSV